MRYLAMLYGAEVEPTDPGTPEFDDELARYARFGEAAGDAIVGGEALHSSDSAVTIRHTADGPIVTDGPYTEAAEVIGGLYVLDVDDLDHAIDLARRIPAAEDGAVELRPLVEWSENDARSGHGDRYLAVLAGPEDDASEPGTPAWDAGAEEHGRFAEEAGDAVLAGGALHPASTATTVRVRDGELLLSDGPFTEASEVVGGLYVLGTATRDEAVDLAERIPIGPDGMVELRPIIELD